MTDARRAGVVALLVLLAGGALLASLPRLASVRLAGVAGVPGGPGWRGLAVAGGRGRGRRRAPAGLRVRRVALAVGVAGLVVPPLAIAALSGRTPWEAWSALASRPALVFRERSAWVTEGAVLLVPTTLVFSEPHRITALGEAVFRVVERDGGRVVVREWRLANGEGLALRPGDRLDLAAGVRVRFEPGKRVPEAPLSGVTWADPRERGLGTALATFLAALVTLASGALVLLPPPRDGDGPHVAAGLAPFEALAVPLVVVSAVCWGVYGGVAGAGVGLGAPPGGPPPPRPGGRPGPPGGGRPAPPPPPR